MNRRQRRRASRNRSEWLRAVKAAHPGDAELHAVAEALANGADDRGRITDPLVGSALDEVRGLTGRGGDGR